jgi:hypothetical protein
VGKQSRAYLHVNTELMRGNRRYESCEDSHLVECESQSPHHVADLTFGAPVPAARSSNHTNSGFTPRIYPQAEYSWKNVQRDLSKYVYVEGHPDQGFDWIKPRTSITTRTLITSIHGTNSRPRIVVVSHLCLLRCLQPSDERCSVEKVTCPSRPLPHDCLSTDQLWE